MTPVSLPYYAASATIPGKLPSIEEIESSQDVLSGQSARRVVGIGPNFVAKYGIAIDLIEGENMLFLQKTVPNLVPRVYALFKETDSGKCFIIMERITGPGLDKEWGKLDDAARSTIV